MSSIEDSAEGLLRPRLPSHLYVHVPFCASKCDYCDFASVAGASESTAEVVFRAIKTQLVQWNRSGLEGVLETIYFGGGTPTLFPEKVIDLLGFVRRKFLVHAAAEITVEANPETLTLGVAKALAAAGVTRVSVGVQSLDDHDLRVLGRIHDADAAYRACTAVRKAGLSLAADLMCAIPGQSRSSWTDTLERAVLTGAEHLSVYPLSVEAGTPLDVAIQSGLLAEQEPDEAAELMVLALTALERHGFERYEVANYAKGRRNRSRHNSAYWTGRSYLGVGPGAHGMADAATARESRLFGELDESCARVRWGNADDIGEWLTGHGDALELMSLPEATREDAMLGLRMAEGITDELARRAGVRDVLVGLSGDGLVNTDGSKWFVTQRGWLLGNEVFGRVWTSD